MNQVPSCFLKLLSLDHTPYQFMDVIGYCLYKGLKLQFSVNKKTGGYFGYFTNNDEQFINSDCFKYFDLDEYLFRNQENFRRYILNNKALVELSYNRRQYVLTIKKERFNTFSRKMEWYKKEQVCASSIKTTFIQMNLKLGKRFIEHSIISNKKKVIHLDHYRRG